MRLEPIASWKPWVLQICYNSEGQYVTYFVCPLKYGDFTNIQSALKPC